MVKKERNIRNRLKNRPILTKIYKYIKFLIYFIFLKPVFFLQKKARKVGLSKKYADLKKFKDIHKDQRCFILATGPSFIEEDFIKLKGEYTFGVNAICMLFKKLQLRTTYMVVTDPKAYAKLYDQLPKNKSVFTAKKSEIHQTIPLEISNSYMIDDIPRNLSDNISVCCYNGNSVVYIAIQIAIYMGFKDIYLLGVDCNYSKDANQWYAVDHGIRDINNDTAGIRMIKDFKVAEREAGKLGVNIYNASRGGMLEVFPRVDLDSIL